MVNQLNSRIRKAVAWLHTNSQEYCEGAKKPYNEPKWIRSLKLYEELVDQANKEGIMLPPEDPYWKYPEDNVKGLELYEIEYIMMGGTKD
jgi:hypothetical protein